jgi:hypothetical protein
MFMIGRRRAAYVLAFGLMVCGTATAQISSEVQSALRSNCRSDAMSKCSGMRGQEALSCLQKNVSSLSPACKTAVDKTLPKPAAVAPAAPPKPAAPPPAAKVEPPAAPTPAITAAPPAPATPSPAVATPAAQPPAAPKPAAAAKPPAPKVAKPAPPRPAAPKPAAPAPQTASAPPAPAAAPTPEQMNALKFTCRHDFGRVCKGVPAGGPEALNCLQQNAARLSPNCKTSLADIADSLPAGAMPAAPAAPVARSPETGGPVDAVVMVRACKLDLMRYCRDVELGEHRKIACLTEHMPKLTVRCRTALKVTSPLR